jgi:uncharacterized repeat protein (TIGR01451 family)
MRKLILLITCYLISIVVSKNAFAQFNGPEQDAKYALLICDSVITQTLGYSGSGLIKDLPDNTSCLSNEENNSVWYKIYVVQSGTLVFKIIPLQPDDYDFILFNTTGVGYEAIQNDTLQNVRCSYSAFTGITGLDYGYSITSAGVADSTFLAPLEVLEGETYYLMTDNFNTGGGGYTIDFRGSTAIIGRPEQDNILNAKKLLCNGDTSIIAEFNSSINTTSISGDEFVIKGSPQVDIRELIPLYDTDSICKKIRLRVTANIFSSNTYELILKDGSDSNTISSLSNFCSFYFKGDTIPIDNNITNNVQPAIADFAFFKMPNEIKFHNLSSNSNKYKWDFGDNSISNDINPSHYYSVGGNINVCLWAENECFLDEKCKSFVYKGNKVNGKVFLEHDLNCTFDYDDMYMNNIIIKAEPGPHYTTTNFFGNYSFSLDQGSFRISQLIPNTFRFPVEQYCPASPLDYGVNFLQSEGQTKNNIDFVNTAPPCSYLSVSYGSLTTRACSTYKGFLQVCNSGSIKASNVRVKVSIPKNITISSLSVQNATITEDSVVFTIDTIRAGQCLIIELFGNTDCGITFPPQCFKVEISPKNDCDVNDNFWDGSNLDINATCINNDSVRFEVINNSNFNMQDSVVYKLYSDDNFIYAGKIKLLATQTANIYMPAYNNLVRCEVAQTNFNPNSSFVYYNQFPCSNSSQSILSGTTYIFNSTINDENAETYEDCAIVLAAYDPNDKQVFPQGIGDLNLTPKNERLHYKIRFQNTGNSYAENVVITDTISSLLDISTIKFGVRSHNYSFNIERGENNKLVLVFNFIDIYLPDSNTNFDASMGFLTYSIIPLANVPELSVVSNNADIYFDYNPPIRTNTVSNTLGSLSPELSTPLRIIFNEPRYYHSVSDFELNILPNPSKNKIKLSISDNAIKVASIKIVSVDGKEVLNQISFISSSGIELDVNSLANGVYVTHVNISGITKTKKLIIAR